MKNKSKKVFLIITFILGLVLATVPTVANIIQNNKIVSVIGTYETEIKNIKNTNKDDLLATAKEYNDNLYKLNKPFDDIITNKDEYLNILNINDGMMGKIEIPIIDVNLPIYHGTSNEVLSIGAGHLEGSSFPVGGKNTHSVITAHRGLANSKMFTRLDEIKQGDLFYINILDEELAYKVIDIKVVDPDNTTIFNIQKDKDLISLMTCTPYGLNTHRLIVTGERIEFDKEVKQDIKPKIMSVREIIFTILPFIFILIVILIFIFERRKKRNDKNN